MELKVLTGSVKRITKRSVVERFEVRLNESVFPEAEILVGVFVVEVRLIYFVLNPNIETNIICNDYVNNILIVSPFIEQNLMQLLFSFTTKTKCKLIFL